MADLGDMLRLLSAAGGDDRALRDPGIAHLVADGHAILSQRAAEGVTVTASERDGWIEAQVTVAEGAAPRHPVHLCFGMLRRFGGQRVRLRIELGAGARARCLAHCLFGGVEQGLHQMEETVVLGPGAALHLEEGHYHGPSGGMEVLPRARVEVGAGARFVSDFSLLRGRVGRLDMDFRVTAEADSVTELGARVFGHFDDRIRLRDQVRLAGERARGLVKSRVVLEGRAEAKVVSVTEGLAAGARGHMDCMEVVKDAARGESVPVVRVRHPEAKITHEAAIGTVDRAQLETLMARGLDPEAAVQAVVAGLLS